MVVCSLLVDGNTFWRVGKGDFQLSEVHGAILIILKMIVGDTFIDF